MYDIPVEVQHDRQLQSTYFSLTNWGSMLKKVRSDNFETDSFDLNF